MSQDQKWENRFSRWVNRPITRKRLLKASATGAGVLASRQPLWALLKPVVSVDNPLDYYPARDWEKVYRDQYKYDSTFTFVCSPNDTHACRLRAFVRNGVMTRIEQNYDVGTYKDLDGNAASKNWGPRGCAKGYNIGRRLYGPYRLKHPIIRKGWKQWADDGFPYLTPELREKYRFTSRGQDEFLKASWDEATTYAAQGLVAVARHYSGEEGKKRLLAEGYEPEQVEAMEGAGTRAMKFRGGMGLLGVIGKYGMYRVANMMALVDDHLRKVGPEKAKGGRSWDNYTWHGDQAPGMPFVHGLQSSESDFNDLRFTKLHIQCGKNLVENKMADSHFFIESMERGAKIVTMTPEYSPPATKADTWIPMRPSTDGAIFLAITKILMDNGWYKKDFVVQFSDFPLLVRTDTLKRLSAKDVFPNYQPGLKPDGASYAQQGLKKDQYEKLGDYVVRDEVDGTFKAVTRDDVGEHLAKKKIAPALEWKGTVKLADGKTVEVLTLWELYKIHLKDYDAKTVAEITHTPQAQIEELAKDIATISPVAIHIGEGINHWFHATLINRAQYLPLILTGNIGKPGAGCHTWAGNYKAALFQGSSWTGKGFKVWVAEDPFHPETDSTVDGKDIHPHAYMRDEAVAYWNHSDRPLIVNTPKKGRKVFTGKTHMPTPTKSIWFTNVNLINNAKHAYEMIKNVNPKVDLIMATDIQMTSSVEYSDIGFPASWWSETASQEITGSCSNPFVQVWKGGLPPLYDSKDDSMILALVSRKVGEVIKDPRCADYWKFALEGKTEVYIQRLMDASSTLRGYQVKDILEGKYGEPGAALMMFRTYPRIPFWEQIHDHVPFYTDTGRLNAYCDIPEAIEYGENFIVHREGPEATPYLPNVIVSSNPYIRPEDYGIPLDAQHWDERTVRNVKMPWIQVQKTENFLWKAGYRFFCLTPKTRHRVHSQWSDTDWTLLLESNFGDPWRTDKRSPGIGEHQLHMHPQAAKDMGFNDGDYVYVDANPADRPYVGWKEDDPFYKVSRVMLRVRYNPAYPYSIIMMKHGAYMATERSVKAHETRPDGRALSAGTGYQSNLRYGSQQSLTRNWHMPMHQTDHLFHKSKVAMEFLFGCEGDNHMINTVPKETLVRVMRAEAGGLEGKGIWEPATSGYTPAAENDMMKRYLSGSLIETKQGS